MVWLLRPQKASFTMGRKGFTLSHQSHSDSELAFRRDLLLTAQVALLGEVSSSIRAVTIGWSTTEIRLRAIVDGLPFDDDVDSMECVGTEIIASFPQHQIAVEVVRLDAPAPLEPHNLKAWVYSRKER